MRISSSNQCIRISILKQLSFLRTISLKPITKSNLSKIFEDLNQKWVSNLNIAEVKNTKIADFKNSEDQCFESR